MFFKKIKESFGKLKEGLKRTRDKFSFQLKKIMTIGRKVDRDFLDELEELLISSDMGVKTSTELAEELETAYRYKEVSESDNLMDFLKGKLRDRLSGPEIELMLETEKPTVILVVGVNGTGKTTSIGKLAYLLKQRGLNVMVAASDTFRAAATEQLTIWSKRAGVDIVKHQEGADPAAVAFDAVEAAVARGTDVLIVDTAGRLHTKTNLMKELEKIKRVLQKKIPSAPHEVILVLDSTTGQNAIQQAKIFNEAVDVTGLFLAKLDGTAKGGIVIAIRSEVDIPVKFVGLGEKMEDIEPFDAETFVEGLFS